MSQKYMQAHDSPTLKGHEYAWDGESSISLVPASSTSFKVLQDLQWPAHFGTWLFLDHCLLVFAFQDEDKRFSSQAAAAKESGDLRTEELGI